MRRGHITEIIGATDIGFFIRFASDVKTPA